VIGTGPTSHAAHFVAGSMRSWGIGLLPLGWARFVGADAAACANRFSDGASDPPFARFADLLPRLFGARPDAAAEAARIDAYLTGLLAATRPAQDEARIVAAHAALLDPDLRTVGELAGRMAMSTRSLERLCLRSFGFSPKLLLRRQRFLRSLAQFMLDPSLTWISTLDFQYVDQAHFVRDFRAFMGMSPRRYASLEHPVLRAAARARAAAAGEAVQLLHRPQGGSAAT
jgi:AraC-like DNA-binding protein